jgi:hypothetical protein
MRGPRISGRGSLGRAALVWGRRSTHGLRELVASPLSCVRTEAWVALPPEGMFEEPLGARVAGALRVDGDLVGRVRSSESRRDPCSQTPSHDS